MFFVVFCFGVEYEKLYLYKNLLNYIQMINWKEYIASNPQVMYGKPVIKNTRVSVELILEKLAEGETISSILEGYPHLKQESIYACLAYAMDSVKNEIIYSIAS